jgi:hypothetical protein
MKMQQQRAEDQDTVDEPPSVAEEIRAIRWWVQVIGSIFLLSAVGALVEYVIHSLFS